MKTYMHMNFSSTYSRYKPLIILVLCFFELTNHTSWYLKPIILYLYLFQKQNPHLSISQSLKIADFIHWNHNTSAILIATYYRSQNPHLHILLISGLTDHTHWSHKYQHCLFIYSFQRQKPHLSDPPLSGLKPKVLIRE